MGKSLIAAIAVAASAVLAACGGPSSAERQTSVSAEGITSLRIVSEAGDLTVSGGEGLTAISATGTVVDPGGARLDGIDFRTSSSGSELLIEALTAGTASRFNVSLTLPAGMSVKIEDGDGNIAVQDVAAVEIVDTNGDIAVRRVGALTLSDTAGDIAVGPMAGDINIRDDGLGDMSFRDIDGNVLIARDSSGAIELLRVRGNVEVLADGDGDIIATDITGDFTVRYDTAGRIRPTSISGTTSLPPR